MPRFGTRPSEEFRHTTRIEDVLYHRCFDDVMTNVPVFYFSAPDGDLLMYN